jgi:hypothetical protein
MSGTIIPFRLAFLLSLFSWPVLSQYNTNFLNYYLTGRSVSVHLDFEGGSSGFTNELFNKLIWGGKIDDGLKNRSSAIMRPRNTFGVAVNYGVTAFVKGGKRFDVLIGAKNQQVLNAVYSRDLFNLMFYGNDKYRGREANLANCSVNALNFQEIKLGIVAHHLDTNSRIGFSISFLRGEQLFHINTLRNSGLYTSPDGSEVVLHSDFRMAMSDTTKKNVTGFNGLGASADIFFETPYKSKKGRNCMLTVNVNNLGFIYWNLNSLQYSSDSILRFSGYQISSINDLKDSALKKLNSDSVLRELTNARHEAFNVKIPANLVLINRIYYNKNKFCLTTGFRYIFNASYIPNVFVEPEFYVGRFILTAHAGYGGYARLTAGGSVTWNARRFFVRLGSNQLQGFILPRYSYGQGLFFSMAVKLK